LAPATFGERGTGGDSHSGVRGGERFVEFAGALKGGAEV